MSEAESFFFFI